MLGKLVLPPTLAPKEMRCWSNPVVLDLRDPRVALSSHFLKRYELHLCKLACNTWVVVFDTI